MNYKFINLYMFAAGAVIGSAVTWKLVKNKYEQIAQEEIDSVKQAFTELSSIRQDEDQEDVMDHEPETHRERSRQINWSELEDLEDEDAEFYEEDENDAAVNGLREEYGRLVEPYINNDEKGGANKMTKEPYVIAPYDFGELDGYKRFELTYYADGILEDEDYNIVKDSEELIGRDSLYTFGEYEDDAVFVRNENLMADFQILKDYRTYAQARGTSPNQVDDE